jgi:hypothetical protein
MIFAVVTEPLVAHLAIVELFAIVAVCVVALVTKEHFFALMTR